MVDKFRLPELSDVVSRPIATAARVAERSGEFDVLDLSREEDVRLEQLTDRYYELLPDDDELEHRLSES